MSFQNKSLFTPLFLLGLTLALAPLQIVTLSTVVLAQEKSKIIVAKPATTALTERDQIFDWIRANLVGKTIGTSTNNKIDEGRIEAEYQVKRTFTNLQKTPEGLTLDSFNIVKQTNYDLDDKGQRMGVPRDKNRSSLSRWFIKQKKSTGKVIGYSTGISSTTSDPTGSASQLSMKLGNNQLILNSSTIGYGDYFAQGGEFKPGASETTSIYEVVNGKLQIKVTSKVFDVDPDTGERTPTGETSNLIYEEIDS